MMLDNNTAMIRVGRGGGASSFQHGDMDVQARLVAVELESGQWHVKDQGRALALGCGKMWRHHGTVNVDAVANVGRGWVVAVAQAVWPSRGMACGNSNPSGNALIDGASANGSPVGGTSFELFGQFC